MKKCLVVVNTYKEDSRYFGGIISDFLTRKGINCELYSFNGYNDTNPFKGNDFVITLGGDGTVLFAARGCVKYGIPVFPINFGEFGFIASIQKEEWQINLESFLSGKSSVFERSMVQATLIRPEEKSAAFSAIGLNDVVISSEKSNRPVLLDVMYNYSSLGNFKADGIIISTPTGSTAYSASAGGPIIDPSLDALVLTPSNSFSLSSRPLILAPDGEIGVTVLPFRNQKVIITVDGQEPFVLMEGDCVKIRPIAEKIKLVGCTSEKFYSALRSKLNWAGGPHA